jgi:DNA invertase Pin-like site-specific DNA recombinase
MKVAVYVRVSTVGQNEAGQRAEIERWLAGNGLQDVLWYVDKHTGDELARPAFRRLQADIFAGTVRTVVVWKLDRLSRKLRDGLNTLADWCEAGIRVVSVTQQIDLSGTVGQMIAAVLLGVAEMEQETRRERQRAGIDVAKTNGKYRGRRNSTTKAKPHRAAELRAKGLTNAEVATALGVSHRSVQRYLKRAGK